MGSGYGSKTNSSHNVEMDNEKQSRWVSPRRKETGLVRAELEVTRNKAKKPHFSSGHRAKESLYEEPATRSQGLRPQPRLGTSQERLWTPCRPPICTTLGCCDIQGSPGKPGIMGSTQSKGLGALSTGPYTPCIRLR